MAEKISLKILIFLSLICVILSACMSPIDIEVFFADDDVKVIVAASKETVKLTDSDPGLSGGNRRITGLDPNKYYMVVKEFDEDGVTEVTPADYPKFVTEYTNGGTVNFTKGQLIDNNLLEYITRIAGGTIIGLANFHTYTVKSAVNFPYTPSATTFTYSDSGGDSNQTRPVNNNGELIIPMPTGDLTLEQLDTDYTDYEIMAVAVGSNPLVNFPGKLTISGTTNSFPLEGAGTTVDYVFFRKTPLDFKVLKVKINDSSAPTVTSVNVTPATANVAKGGTQSFIASVTGTNSPAQTVTWTVDAPKATGTTISAGGVLTVAADETNTSLIIRATSTVDTNKSGTAAVTVTNPQGTATITLSFPINEMDPVTGNVTIVNDAISITKASYLSGTNIVFIAPSTLTGITWTIGGVDITNGLSTVVITNDRLTINNSESFVHYFAGSTVVVNVKGTIDGKQYSKYVQINLTGGP
jgi:hypothetical protein